MLWRALHARGDTYLRGEGHITPDTLVSLLLWRYSPLQDHATGESASVATRQRGCGGAEMRAGAHSAPTQTRDSRGPTVVEGAGADQVDALVIKPQTPGLPV